MSNSNIELSCVCGGCGKTSSKDIKLEINFVHKMIYWFCPECKKMNQIDLNQLKDIVPLPRMRLS